MTIIDNSIKSKLLSVKRNPSVVKEIIEDRIFTRRYKKEINSFVQEMKSSQSIKNNDEIKLNKLCCLEDWDNPEMSVAMSNLRNTNSPEGLHRKNWEWSLGIIAMSRLNKLNKDSIALGVGSGREPVLFYLSNKVKHVFATDLYEGGPWTEAPADFPDDPQKYSSIVYRNEALTAIKMDAKKLEFPSNQFDIVFSFSSIEHFGGNGHTGACQAVNEMERVLKNDGIAVIATEFIINNKDHPQFFNRTTIFSDLIDKVQGMKLVETLDLTVSPRTLDAILDYFPYAAFWDNLNKEFKLTHPHVLLRRKNILFTSVMLVFKK